MSSLPHGLAAGGKWLNREFNSLWHVFLFFLVAFLIQLLIIKLTVARLSIPLSAFSKAVVGALLAAKAVLILDGTPLARSLQSYRRIVAVAVKTFLYGVASLLLLSVERLLEALHKVHHLGAAVGYALEHASRYRIMAWALGISIVFALYFTFLEINKRMGEDGLRRLFFESPQATNSSSRQAAIGAGKSRI